MDITLFAAKIHDDNKRISLYSKQLLNLIKKEFMTRNIEFHDYERFINILQIMNLQTEETRKDIDHYIKFEMNKRIKIDVTV